MKKFFSKFIILIILLSICIFMFIPFFNFKENEINIELNSKYNIDKNGYFRSKKIKLNHEDNIDATKVGEYYVIYKTNIKSGINRKKKIIVHVIDDDKPTIELIGDKEITLNYKEEYKEPGYKANDNYNGDITSNVKIKNNINYDKLGTYSIKYTIKDSSKNETTAERKIIIKDSKGPVIDIKRNKNSYLILNSNNIDINDFTATDDYDGDVTKDVIVTGSVDNTKKGLYKVTYRVSDKSGNETMLESTINVQKKNTKGIPVLMYHWFYDDTNNEKPGKANAHNYISKTELEKQLKYLSSSNFYFPSFEELEEYISGKINLPEKSVILTDDDSTKDFFRVTSPIIEKYKIPMVSFVITKKNNWKKYTNNEYYIFESHTNDLHIRSCKGVIDGAAMCLPYNTVYEDIKTSVDKLNKDVAALAYPFGHYNNNFIKALKENNIELAFTIDEGRVKKGSNKYKLPRVRISSWTSFDTYKSLVN